MSIRPKIIALMMGTALISSCTKQEEITEEAPRPVLSMTVRQTPATTLRLTGTIKPTIETELGFRILGRMIARNVNVGDVVKKGDVVAAIDPLALELAVRSAQSDVENSDAQLRNAVTTEQRQRALVESRSGTEPRSKRPSRRDERPRRPWPRHRPISTRPKSNWVTRSCGQNSMAS